MTARKHFPFGLLLFCIVFPCVMCADNTTDTTVSTEATTGSGPDGFLSFRIPQLLDSLRDGQGGRSGLAGLGLNASQVQMVQDFAQLLVNGSGNSPDISSALQSSGLLNSLGANKTMGPLVFDHSPLWDKCKYDVGFMLGGVLSGQQWALQMLDASAKPGSGILKGHLRFMGNYQECNQVMHQKPFSSSKIEGNICRFSVPVPFPLPKNLMMFGKPKIQWDVCLPNTCIDSDMNSALKQFNLGISVQCTKDLDISEDASAIAATSVLTLFGALLVAGTIMGLYVGYLRPKMRHPKNGHVFNGHAHTNQGFKTNENVYQTHPEPNGTLSIIELNAVHDDMTKVGDHSDIMNVESNKEGTQMHEDQENKTTAKPGHLHRWERALLAFSIPLNTEKILSVKSSPGNIGCLHGIRVLSMAWVILGHVFLVSCLSNSLENPVTLIGNLDTLSFQLVINAFLSVDTFFVMSGFLTCYLFLKSLAEKGKITPKEFFMYYIHRYWRLTPSLMIWIMIVACLLKYVGEGRPAWNDYWATETCRNNWWINLLYINNVYKREEACIGVTWYLAHDMQFYVIAPLALIPWLYGKAIIGFVVAFCYVGIHIASTIWIQMDINAGMFRNTEDYSNEIYFKPYTRAAPFAIGLMLGWVLWTTKCKVRIHKALILFGWIVSLGLILTLTLVTYEDNKDLGVDGAGWSKAVRVIFEICYRPLWAVAISWMIFACATGNGGMINSFLSWEGWMPLSRLTYSAFLVHMTILQYELNLPEFTTLFTWTSLSYRFVGTFVMSYAVGYLLTVTVESPMLALEKAILTK